MGLSPHTNPPPLKPKKEHTMKRKRLSKRASRKNFTKGAKRTNKKNLASRPMRGGYRL